MGRAKKRDSIPFIKWKMLNEIIGLGKYNKQYIEMLYFRYKDIISLNRSIISYVEDMDGKINCKLDYMIRNLEKVENKEE